MVKSIEAKAVFILNTIVADTACNKKQESILVEFW